MNPSSLRKDIWLRRVSFSGAKTPACRQAGKDMNRNRLGDELGETNKYVGSELFDDEGCSYRVIFSGISRCIGTGSELTAFGSPSTIENISLCEATSHLKLERYLNYFISSI